MNHKERTPIPTKQIVVGGGVFSEEGLGFALKGQFIRIIVHGNGDAYTAG